MRQYRFCWDPSSPMWENILSISSFFILNVLKQSSHTSKEGKWLKRFFRKSLNKKCLFEMVWEMSTGLRLLSYVDMCEKSHLRQPHFALKLWKYFRIEFILVAWILIYLIWNHEFRNDFLSWLFTNFEWIYQDHDNNFKEMRSDQSSQNKTITKVLQIWIWSC